jgi:1,4-alpha-glucan branching enzyme
MASPDPNHLAYLEQMEFDPRPVLQLDGYLKPHVPAIATRYRSMRDWQAKIDQTEGGMDKFTRGYERFGLNVGPKNEVTYREWAPNAVNANLIGDFSTYHGVIHKYHKPYGMPL